MISRTRSSTSAGAGGLSALVRSIKGGALAYTYVGHIITETTHRELGVAVNPHLFRDCAVYTVATHAGDRMGIASGLLQHTDQRTVEVPVAPEPTKRPVSGSVQVYGGNVRRVVTQKGAPSLAWRPASPNHVFGDARLRDTKPELEQFAVDARPICP